MSENVVAIIVLVLAFGLAAVGVWYWIGILNEISRTETDPRERKKWWWRVFLLRFIGILWYRSHRDRSADRRPPSGEG